MPAKSGVQSLNTHTHTHTHTHSTTHICTPTGCLRPSEMWWILHELQGHCYELSRVTHHMETSPEGRACTV